MSRRHRARRRARGRRADARLRGAADRGRRADPPPPLRARRQRPRRGRALGRRDRRPTWARSGFAVGLIASRRRSASAARPSCRTTRLQARSRVPARRSVVPVVDIQGQVIGVSGAAERQAGCRAGRLGRTRSRGAPPATSILPINARAHAARSCSRSRTASARRGSASRSSSCPSRASGSEARRPGPRIPPHRRLASTTCSIRARPRGPASGPGDFLVGLGGHAVFAVGDFQTWLCVAGIGSRSTSTSCATGSR